jgi:primary-amine oxidase
LGQKLSGRDLNYERSFTGANSCFESNFTEIHAPKKNIWTGLTDPEAASVLSWLFKQADLNLTAAKDAGDWDNTMYGIDHRLFLSALANIWK